jgi:hypothetical protein
MSYQKHTAEEHEQILREMEEQFGPLFEQSPVGVYLYLTDSHKICNERMAHMHGMTVEEWRSTPTFLNDFIAGRFQAFYPKAPTRDPEGVGGRSTVLHGRKSLRLLSFSVFVGILSHIGFDLISHDTNLLLYPWVENAYWFPQWWYTIWIEITVLSAFGRTYSVGVFTIVWCMLTQGFISHLL